MRRFLILCLIVIVSFIMVLAQNATDDLVANHPTVLSKTDIFGAERLVVEGELVNNGGTAYSNISLYVEAQNAGGEVIGEGYGYIVNACDEALIDYALQPGKSIRFSADFEQFADGEIAQLNISADATATEPEQINLSLTFTGLRAVSGEEVVSVEWLDTQNLRYGVGCAGHVFTELDWYTYNVESGISTPIEHPDVALVTDALIQQTGITKLSQSGEVNPSLYNASFLTFSPSSRRILYQTDLHALISAERDGSFKRVIQEEGLFKYSLQGFIWMPQGRFLAYYFGAYGDVVRYLTATVEGNLLSAPLESVTQSVTVPGPSEDGLYAVIGGTFEQGTGYYLKSTFYEENIFLFEAALPGNNWPAPVYWRKSDVERYAYVIRPVDGQAQLQCFERDANQLHVLTGLPLQLDINERAWSWVAPDYSRLAISANGAHSGLWIVDLNAFEVCR